MRSWAQSAEPWPDHVFSGDMDHAPSKGELIRAKIEANRQKRLAIAAAMKAEAGVRGHEINKFDRDLSGLAWLETGDIRSPDGRNMAKLVTLAHECGHIFLHSAETPGYRLPGHVKEMEAESYAHQAFAAHGMSVPKNRTAWGRQYVATWVVKDHAAGIPIDPLVLAYVAGARSPFEPLRDQPETWCKAVQPEATPVPAVVIKAPRPVEPTVNRVVIAPVVPAATAVQVSAAQPATSSSFGRQPPVWLALICGLAQLAGIAGPVLAYLHLADGAELSEYGLETWGWLAAGALALVGLVNRLEAAGLARRAERALTRVRS